MITWTLIDMVRMELSSYEEFYNDVTTHELLAAFFELGIINYSNRAYTFDKIP